MYLTKSRTWLIFKNVLSLTFFYGTLFLIAMSLLKHIFIMSDYIDTNGNIDKNVLINFLDLINWILMKYFLDNRTIEQIVNELCSLIKNEKEL